jgi:hypothetical protein
VFGRQPFAPPTAQKIVHQVVSQSWMTLRGRQGARVDNRLSTDRAALGKSQLAWSRLDTASSAVLEHLTVTLPTPSRVAAATAAGSHLC